MIDATSPIPSDSYVQSFARGLAVIRSFSASAPSQTLTDVAQRTGLTRAGARRILLTLHGLGYVDIDGRQFRLTAKVLDLGFAYLSGLPFWSLAEPCMEDLVRETQESCSAAVLDGQDIVYVLRVPTRKIIEISLGVGSRLPAYCTAMGRVLLAGLDDAVLNAYLQQLTPHANTRHTLTTPAQLRDAIAQVRQQGWSLVCEELEDGLLALAAPIMDRTGRVTAALNLSSHTSRTSGQAMQQQALPALLRTARAISTRLGHGGPGGILPQVR